METLKKYFPLSFKEKGEITRLFVDILLYLAMAVAAGLVMSIFSGVPVLNWLFYLVGAVTEVYVVSGIVLAVMDYLKIAK